MSGLFGIAAILALAGCDSSTAPQCKTIYGSYSSAYPDVYFFYNTGVNTIAMTDTLSARYGFTPMRVDTAVGLVLIPAPQPATVLSGLRCEPSIWDIGYDGPISVD